MSVEVGSPSESLWLFCAGTSIVFDMSLTYILVALAAVLLNNVVVERLNLHTRITTGSQGHPALSPPRGSTFLLRVPSLRHLPTQLPSLVCETCVVFLGPLWAL